MMKHVYLLLCLFAFSATATPIRLTNSTQADNLFGEMELLKVPAGQVSLRELLQNPARYPFVQTRNRDIEPYNRTYGYWLRFTIINETSASYFLQFVYDGTEAITVYEVAAGRAVAIHTLGTLHNERVYPFLKSNQVVPIALKQGQTHTFYVYLEGIYTTAWPIYCRSTINLLQHLHLSDLFYGFYYGFILMIIVYSLLLYSRLRETDTFRYAIWVIVVGLQLALFRGHTNEFLGLSDPDIVRYATVLAGVTGLLHTLFTLAFLRLRQQAPLYYKIGVGIFALYALGMVINVFSVVTMKQHTGQQIDIVPPLALVEGMFSIWAGVAMYRRGFRPALFYSIGNLLFYASIFVFLLYAFGQLPHSFWTYNSIHIGSALEIILFTLALTYKVNLLKQGQETAIQEQLRLTEANKQLVEQQNSMLEIKVKERTNELNTQKNSLQNTLAQLRTTQTQLIQQEKMASLGELMAGIAHEIQNPLNFVNNFSEVSTELVDEMQEELKAGNPATAIDLAGDLKQNLSKITHHGQRASSIVKGMLEHSRTSAGERQSTNLNALADEYLRLAYQGIRRSEGRTPGGPAKQKDFNCALVTDFDPNLGQVDIVPQEISRVLLNLYTNGFYAVQQRSGGVAVTADYQPTLWVSTKQLADTIEIRVRDNGTGIPESVKAKIFQPFFTTKPTGEGTGLGLSLSYDIVTKGHGGTLEVESVEGEGTTFIIKLP